MTQLPPELRSEALLAFLMHVADVLGVETIDQLWIFPVQRAGTLESSVLVVSAFEQDPERRRVITAHRTTRRPPKAPPEHQDVIVEQGTAPSDRITRLVDGVLRRIGDDVAASPHPVDIGGADAAWGALLESLHADAA